MALSQCLDDSPARWPTKQGNDYNLQEFYNERHRLALEELVSGGVDNFREFLIKESIPNFLSDDEIRCIGRTAVDPRCTSNQGEEMTFEQSVRNSMDCSSVTYFPEISDIEPPVLEIGWPAFTSGSFRGVTRAVAHFQPSYGECIYSCKEAARRMIKSAKEVIAIVTDSLTDLDIFKDLQEACITRKVPVYILLDQSCAPAFFKMCSNLKVQLEELQQMRVRTITGGTYFMRSGAKITGKVHERFMLIDGNRVATGSYRFNWTDGKLNSSNLIELSGQITENFDEEFRILYAQSMPFNSQVPPSVRNSGIYDHLLIRPQVTSSPLPAKVRPKESICQTSTPSRASVQAQGTHRELTEERGGHSSAVSNSSTVGENWMEQQHMQEVLTGSVVQCFSPDKTPPNTVIDQLASPIKPPCHVFTQTSSAKVNTAVQTDLEPSPLHADLPLCPDNTTPAHSITSIQKGSVSSSNASSASRNYLSTPGRMVYPPGLRHCTVPPDDNLRDCFRKLTKERQYHYSTIRSKLEHMVTMLSHRRELVELTNMALGTGVLRAQKAQKEFGQRLDPGLLMDGMGTWPRARCLH